jgi:hypothetical protein
VGKKKRRRTEVFCLKCAGREVILAPFYNKPVPYEAYRMRALYYIHKGKKRIFGYVCPNCGHIFRMGMPPLEDKTHTIPVERAVISDVEKIIIPTEKTYIRRR